MVGDDDDDLALEMKRRRIKGVMSWIRPKLFHRDKMS